jgi:hypothetical protein
LPQPAGDDEALAIAEFEDEPVPPNGEVKAMGSALVTTEKVKVVQYGTKRVE